MVLNVEIYNDHIRQTKEFSLTVSKVEEFLIKQKYTGQNRKKDPAVENLLLPPISLTFYHCVYEDGQIPSEMRLIEAYLDQEEFFSYTANKMVEVSYGGRRSLVLLESLIARILRTYPSLVRDLHFYLMAHESGLFSAVRYSVGADYKQGVDIKVKYNEHWYNIGLYVSTKRSLFYKGKKFFRHNPVDIINFELYPNEAHMVGDFMLYSRDHISRLLSLIAK